MREVEYLHEVMVTSIIEFTRDEVEYMIACSEAHYDQRCREAAIPGPGGLLNGIRVRVSPDAETAVVDLTTRELDLLCKILEVQPRSGDDAGRLRGEMQAAFANAVSERRRLDQKLAQNETVSAKGGPLGRCPSIHGRWRCSEPAVGPHVHALRDAEGRPIAVWLDDGRLLLTPELPGEDDAFAAADEQDRMIALALLDNAHTIAQCTIDALAEGGGEGAKNAALLAVELLHALCCIIAELEEPS